MTRDDCRELLAYNDWANDRVFSALAELGQEEWAAELGGSFGSIAATASHMVAAEWIWLRRWQGASPRDSPAWVESPELPPVRDALETLARERSEWLDALPESALGIDLEYTFLSGVEAGTRLAVLVRHLVNHSTYHRGQLATLLRLTGRTPPATDLVLWDLERREAAAG